MNIKAQKGHKVVYTGASEDQASFAGCTDPRSVLTEGAEYTVDHTEPHSWHTKVVLEGVAGKFNSGPHAPTNFACR